jgi:hypothetical protein
MLSVLGQLGPMILNGGMPLLLVRVCCRVLQQMGCLLPGGAEVPGWQHTIQLGELSRWSDWPPVLWHRMSVAYSSAALPKTVSAWLVLFDRVATSPAY